MIFLIEYNRKLGNIVAIKSFDDVDHGRAEMLRLEKELELNRKRIDHEVILLQAASEKALLQTHRRYFQNVRQIVSSTDNKKS